VLDWVEEQAEEEWVQLCEEIAANSLFKTANSWVFGANIPGKKASLVFFFGGLQNYRARLKEIIEGGWKGFKQINAAA